MNACDLLSHFPDAAETGESQWQARCPTHDDNKASLSIGIGNKGQVLLHCHAGCSTHTILEKVGLKMADLLP